MDSLLLCKLCGKGNQGCVCDLATSGQLTVKNSQRKEKAHQYDFSVFPSISESIDKFIEKFRSPYKNPSIPIPPIYLSRIVSVITDYLKPPFQLEIFVQCGNQLKIYNIEENRMTLSPSIHFISTLSSSICYDSNSVYIVGGLEKFLPSNQIISISKTDFSNQKRIQLAQARYFAGSAILGNKLIVVGGVGNAGTVLDSLEVIDLKTEKSIQIYLEFSLKRPSLAVIDGDLYIAGPELGNQVLKISKETFENLESDIKVNQNMKKIDWIEDEIYFIANFRNRLVIIGKSSFGIDELNNIQCGIDFSLMWSQQNIIGLDEQLYFFDYFSGELVRVYMGNFF